MTERAAHLVDEMFPHVPVRRWVLSLPLRLRYRLAWDHDLCRAVTGRALQAILIDVLACPPCGGCIVVIAIVEDPAMIGRVLRHLGLQATIPEPCPFGRPRCSRRSEPSGRPRYDRPPRLLPVAFLQRESTCRKCGLRTSQPAVSCAAAPVRA